MTAMKDFFIKLIFNIQQIYIIFTVIYSFCLKEWNLEANLQGKEEYPIQTRNLKQALNRGLVLRKVHRVIKFNKKTWLKPSFSVNSELRKKARNDFQKYFFKLMNYLKKTVKMWENTKTSSL